MICPPAFPRCLPSMWLGVVLAAGLADRPVAAATPLALEPHDHVVIVGNTLAERMQYFGHFETLLHARHPQHELYVRDLGWSGDELTLRLRSQGFHDHGSNLVDHKPDVLIAMFGFNESFAGPAGVAKFEKDLAAFVRDPHAIDRYASPGGAWDRAAEAKEAAASAGPIRRIVLVSPIAHENLRRPGLPDGSDNNRNIALYTEAMRKVAAAEGVAFVDLFTASRDAMAKSARPWTINGIHLNEHGDREVAGILDNALFGPPAATPTADLATLRAAVNEKNLQFFYDHRGVNGCYVYGGRKNPYGTVNFPAEFQKLRAMTAVRDRRIWHIAEGKPVPDAIDDSGTGEIPPVASNVKPDALAPTTTPAESLALMEVEDGYEVNLFASEVEFPNLANPVQLTFDARGRMWVATMPGYPQYFPGRPVDDKILIYEDTDGDGKADKETVFAGGLHLPTGLEIADGGCYVAQEPNLVFLKDTDGDDRADVREIVLDGFDSADSHHAIGAFVSDPGGGLLMMEGTFHQTAVETIRGPKRCSNAGIFRYDRNREQFDVFVSYGFANPWGQTFDRWGQYFVADASGGANYFGTAFSGDVDYPQKHGSLKQFLQKQWRPTSGCEFVSSRQFPDDAQGNYLLNNCIGFQGVLQYKMREDGSGYAADPVDPLLKSNDPNFRPVDLEFGADGCLYVVDWYNPLVGHMQHSLRDPNRDHFHGRVWRVKAKDRPLVVPTKIAGEPTEKLLDALNVYEDRTRYRARAELRARPAAEVIPALETWVAALDARDPDFQHHLVEALWAYQAQDVVNEPLLDRLLASPEPKARAAATRVLSFWRDRAGDAYGRLRKLVADEHPLVRLEAVRALSFFRDQEAIFRRAEVACMKCHAIAKAWGNIGPELSAVGSISPPEYVVASILTPDASIKEAYVTRNVVTDSGEVHTGILVDRDELRVRLRDATGKVITIPMAEIEEEVEGKSLMPKGLTTFLTEQEFLDLAKFVSELGKPGPYAIRSTPTIQRWKLLENPPAKLAKAAADSIPADEEFEKLVLKGPGLRWKTAYAKTARGLPLDELVAPGGSGLQTLWLQGEIILDAPGPVDLRIKAPEGTAAWIAGKRIDLAQTGSVPLAHGGNRLTRRVPATPGTGQEVQFEVRKTKGSPRRVDVAGGP